ncbi:MAG: phosphoglycerate dehydrogenase [Cytophagales bacterium]|nr:phosphoglycerate dehydrogenase [Cytophagales bacterium]
MNERQNVLIVNKMHRSIGAMLREIGWESDYQPEIDREDILKILPKYQGLIIRSKTVVDQELIEKGSNLKFVARAGAGLDQIDISALDKRKVDLINAPEGNRGALGEHTIGMLLSLLHNLNKASNEIKLGKWDREGNRGIELSGKTIGIYGYGYMGSSFAEKLNAFGCRVIAYDKYKEEFSERHIQEVSLEHFEKETEILSIHVPLTSETRNYFTVDYLRSFENLKFVLNTARGEVLPLKGVLQLLEDGKLLGAGLDVLENEKLDSLNREERKIFDALTQRSDVIMTPHVGGWTNESYVRINEVIVNKMIEKGLSENVARTSKN